MRVWDQIWGRLAFGSESRRNAGAEADLPPMRMRWPWRRRLHRAANHDLLSLLRGDNAMPLRASPSPVDGRLGFSICRASLTLKRNRANSPQSAIGAEVANSVTFGLGARGQGCGGLLRGAATALADRAIAQPKPARTAKSRKPRKPLPAHAYYVQRAILFSVCGRWPMSFAERREIEWRLQWRNRGWYGYHDKPQEPAPTLPDSHAASAKRFLERRGWTLVKNASGFWQLQRVPNF